MAIRLIIILCLFSFSCKTSKNKQNTVIKHKTHIDTVETSSVKLIPDVQNLETIVLGNEKLNQYLKLVKNKKIGLVVNHTSMLHNTHLVDTLLEIGVDIKLIFAPEHGFRGTVEAGEVVNNQTDKKTGLPIVSLYGANKKPTVEQLKNIDVLLFDIQDVGARFYTYISTLSYCMEACAENGKELIVLDRPNPNGFYVDGPILDTANKSFVGLHPIPIVHGLTVGEYAMMLNGEGWLKNKVQCKLHVLTCKGYTHKSLYIPLIPPSPNLNTKESIYLYPSLCLFEGTTISVGRGTDKPFTVYGHPDKFKLSSFAFTPKPSTLTATPLYVNKTCFGVNCFAYADSVLANPYLRLDFFINARKEFLQPTEFYNSFLVKLYGSNTLKEMLEANKTEKEIRASWMLGLNNYKIIRKKYLLYKDFE